jgi:RimJ/RimL family protein N-acetyltransferase
MKYLLNGQETQRLSFRLLKPEDFQSWLPLFKGDNVAKYLGLDTTLTQEQLCELWFDRVFDRYVNNLGGMNVLIDKKANQLIGQCGLLVQTVEEQLRLEIGYSILPQFWNKGYATEAAQKCRDYAFENNCAQSLISIVHIDNIASEKVALNNGMALKKYLENYKSNPVNIFGINQKDWKNNDTTS